MINFNDYKKLYFKDKIFVSHFEILDHYRNFGIKSDREKNYSSTELIKLICDKCFFFKVNSSSIKNMFYTEKIPYHDFTDCNQIERYFYRLIQDHVNRVLVMTGKFCNKNCKSKVSENSKNELINNLDNDVIYLSENIILLRHQTFLSLLWKCKAFCYANDLISEIENLNFSIYYLKNKWDFCNE